MTDADYDGFVREFRRLSSALERFKQTPDELRAKADVYFSVLKRSTLAEVSAKADRWLEKETTMPKPSQWAAVVISQGVEIAELTPAEAAEWRAADQASYEAPPCSCGECRAANVSDLPLRFVPLYDRDDRAIKGRLGTQIVTRGEWIHGFPLARYYMAREEFWRKAEERFPGWKPGPAVVMDDASPRTRRHKAKLELVTKR